MSQLTADPSWDGNQQTLSIYRVLWSLENVENLESQGIEFEVRENLENSVNFCLVKEFFHTLIVIALSLSVHMPSDFLFVKRVLRTFVKRVLRTLI